MSGIIQLTTRQVTGVGGGWAETGEGEGSFILSATPGFQIGTLNELA